MSDFQFIASSRVLLDSLEAVGAVVPTNPAVPILENVLFSLDRSGTLTLRASDLQTTLIGRLFVEAPTGTSGAVALPYKLLRGLLHALAEQPVTISVNSDNFSANVLTDNGLYHISGENPIDFPKLPAFGAQIETRINSSTLAEAISAVASCCSTDDLRPAMTGMFWEFAEDGHVFVATDSHCLARLRVRYTPGETAPTREGPAKADGKPISVIVPHKALKLIHAVLPVNEPVAIDLSDSQIRLAIGFVTVYARLIDERFPDFEFAIPTDNPISVHIGRQDLQQALSRVLLLANKSTGTVSLGINGKMSIEAQDLNYNHNARESLLCNHEGDDITIGFDGRLTVKLLKIMGGAGVSISLSQPKRAAIFRPLETPTGGSDLMLLQMPLLLNPTFP